MFSDVIYVINKNEIKKTSVLLIDFDIHNIVNSIQWNKNNKKRNIIDILGRSANSSSGSQDILCSFNDYKLSRKFIGEYEG